MDKTEAQAERFGLLSYDVSLGIYSADLLFALFMVILSLVIALGVRQYFKRKAFSIAETR